MDCMVRPLGICELPALLALFAYDDIEDMLSENKQKLAENAIDIFGLFYRERLVGELRAAYVCEDRLFAVWGCRAYLYAFRVHGDFQGRGLGKYLLESVIDILIQHGYSEFTVGVEDANDRARHIYKSFGFDERLARKYEEYQGCGYTYDLYLKHSV